MLENGYIKLHRQLTQWRWYKSENTARIFLHLLLIANYEECQWFDKTIKPGQVVTSMEHIADDLGLTRKTVKKHIKKLCQTGEISVETTNKYTIVTIRNYGKYQDRCVTITHQSTQQGIQQDTQQRTQQGIHNGRNIRNIRNEERNKKEPSPPLKAERHGGEIHGSDW